MARSTILFAAFGLFCAGTLPAAAIDYTGKTVTIIVNHAAGGSTDLEARLIARHLPRVVPGAPTFIVRNVTGAGGSVAANWLGEIAKPDGLTITYLGGIAAKGAMLAKDLRVDLKHFPLVGTSPGVNVTFARRDLLPSFTKPDDLLKASGFWVGGLSPDSNKDVRIRMQLDLLGLKYNYLTGYPGSSEARLALRRKEIQVYVEALSTYRSAIEPDMFASGEILPVWYDPLFKDGKSYRSPATDGIPAEPFDTFVTRVQGKEPSGDMWDAYKLVTQFSTTFLYLVMMPPGSPPDAVATMQTALLRLNGDRTYRDEAKKMSGSDTEFAVGQELEARFLETMNPDPKIRQFVEAYIAQGSDGTRKK
jgi:hypothetical protein